jgi:acyl-CoA synthetase (AMP-forming)/AMP-acid ligase II
MNKNNHGLYQVFRGAHMIKTKEMSLAEVCVLASQKYKKRIAFEIYRAGGICRPMSYGLLWSRARQFASLFLSLGLGQGDRILLAAENSPDWAAAFFGINLAGAIAVPLNADEAPGMRGFVASGAAALCAGKKNAEKFAGLDPALPRVVIDSVSMPPLKRPRRRGGRPRDSFIEVSIHGIGKKISFAEPEPGFVFPAVKGGETAVLFYTPGKGPLQDRARTEPAGISGAELVSGALRFLSQLRLYPRDRLLSLIPFSQGRESIEVMLAALMGGSLSAFLPDVSHNMENAHKGEAALQAAQALRPTVMTGGAAFIERLCGEKIIPSFKAHLCRPILARRFAEARAGKKFLKQLGSLVRFFWIGEGALSPDTGEFLRRVGFPFDVLQKPEGPAQYLYSIDLSLSGKGLANSLPDKQL